MWAKGVDAAIAYAGVGDASGGSPGDTRLLHIEMPSDLAPDERRPKARKQPNGAEPKPLRLTTMNTAANEKPLAP